mmetsp:Transcript_57390/g.140731  ORF Transcript_57390/g.140731 Transcript_57390/m.140731 type:complete len:219 (-) Transcript_57390:99-755(-)
MARPCGPTQGRASSTSRSRTRTASSTSRGRTGLEGLSRTILSSSRGTHPSCTWMLRRTTPRTTGSTCSSSRRRRSATSSGCRSPRPTRTRSCARRCMLPSTARRTAWAEARTWGPWTRRSFSPCSPRGSTALKLRRRRRPMRARRTRRTRSQVDLGLLPARELPLAMLLARGMRLLSAVKATRGVTRWTLTSPPGAQETPRPRKVRRTMGQKLPVVPL